MNRVNKTTEPIEMPFRDDLFGPKERWGSRPDESIRRRDGWQDDDAAVRPNSLTTCYIITAGVYSWNEIVSVHKCSSHSSTDWTQTTTTTSSQDWRWSTVSRRRSELSLWASCWGSSNSAVSTVCWTSWRPWPTKWPAVPSTRLC